MMLSEKESDKCELNSSSRRFLHDVEHVSARLNIHRKSFDNKPAQAQQKSKSNVRTGDILHNDKKSSIWRKPWKALSHIRSRQFDCWFFLHVHSIEGLSPEFNDTSVRVHWKRKEKEMQTRPAKVSQGKAQFEETLMNKCSVYGSKSHHKNAKYEPKVFLLYAMVVEATVVDMGRHHIDLTKLLPLTLEELDDTRCSGKWTSSFKLSGRAEGGILNVSFGFSVRRENFLELGSSSLIPTLLRKNKSNIRVDAVEVARDGDSGRLRRAGSSASNSKRYLLIQSQSADSNLLGENSNADVDIVRGSGRLPRVGSSARSSRRYLLVQSKSFDNKTVSEEVPDRESESGGLNCLVNEKVDEEDLGRSEKSSCEDVGKECKKTIISIPEEGIEKMPSKEPWMLEGADQISRPESIDVLEISEDEGIGIGEDKGCDVKNETSSANDNHDSSRDSKHVENDNGREDVKGEVSENDEVEFEFNPMGENYLNKINQVLLFENANVEIIDVSDIFKDDEVSIDEKSVFNSTEDRPVIGITEYGENELSTEEQVIERIYLDDIRDSVANEFLRGLAIDQNPSDQDADSEPESPRELLLREFEVSGGLNLNIVSEKEIVGILDGDSHLPLVVRVNDEEDGIKNFVQSLRIKKDAELLEYTETEALMKEWGFNEDVFQNSPGSSGFGSPVYLPVEEPMEYPPLGEGLGSTIQTKGGGFLRSMNPLLFKNVKNGGSLIMQVSAPVVIPAAMGSSIMEILQHWASVGYDKMCMQVDELMPLEDISGKMLQQVAWEIASRSANSERLPYLHQESEAGNCFLGLKTKVKETPFSWGCEDSTSTLLCDGMDIDYVSLEGLVSLAIDKVEALLIEGLRVQSDMAGEEAPSVLEPEPLEETSAFLGMNVVPEGSLILEDMDEAGASDDLDELISLSLRLDEWMRLDAGIFGDEDEMSERISKLMEVHLNGNMEFDSPTLIRDKSTGENCGLLGNNFTVAIRVQLRDPLRDYETVGTSMVSLVEVERVFLDPKPIIHCRVSEGDDYEGNYTMFDQVREETNAEEEQAIMEEATPLFRVTEVHVAGFSIDPSRKLNQGAIPQEHSGFRWLLASGMGEMKKHIQLKTNAIVRSHSLGARKTEPRDTLWSISSRVHSPGAKWKELATSNVYIRNPDVVFLS